VFPQAHFGDDLGLVREFAQAAEELGFAHLIAYDHVVGASHAGRDVGGPYTEEHPFREPLTMFAYLAGVTSEIELATGILILPQRQTVLVAKQAAEVSLFSEGRLRLGVSVGWNRIEYEVLDAPWEGRGARLEEQVAVLRDLWSQRLVDFDGDFHRLDRVSILPRPQSSIPVWLGGQSPAAYRRAARIADGFIFPGPQSLVLERMDELRRCLDETGRDPASFGVETFVDYGAGPDRWVADLETYRVAGFSHIALRFVDDGEPDAAPSVGPGGFVDALTRYADAVGLSRGAGSASPAAGEPRRAKYATISTGRLTDQSPAEVEP
jgi:probable F420-dependent oxidoreductase